MKDPLTIHFLGSRGWHVLAWLLLTVALRATEARPTVGPGATRDEVIAAYGWPNGQSQTGAREILTYSQGRVTLEDGQVTEVDFSPTAVWQAPRPRPPEPTTAPKRPVATVVKEMPPVDYWGTDYAAAVQEATLRHARIIALFSGSDWSPASKQFHAEVELHPEFAEAVLGDFVLLRLDFPAHASQPPEVREQNARLREKFGVTIYPSLLILSRAGERVASVDLTNVSPAQPYRGQVIAAVREVLKLLTKPRPAPSSTVDVAEVAAKSAEENRGYYIIPGITVVLLFLWLKMRRKRQQEASEVPAGLLTDQLPTPGEVAGWSQSNLCTACEAVFEVWGYQVRQRPPESGAEISLFRESGEKAEVLVACHAGPSGLANGRVLRELLGTVIAEGVSTGWVVATAGFTPDARRAAAEHGIRMIGAEEVVKGLAEVPPHNRLRILLRIKESSKLPSPRP